jgi:hypothetical protein
VTKWKCSLIFGVALLAALYSPSSSLAQNTNGTIVGTITDISGAVVASAKVTIVNEGTNIENEPATSSSGEFVAPNLPPGSYSVKVMMTGFKPSITNHLKLLSNRTERVNVVLEPGMTTERIEVTAKAAVLNSENATVGSIMESSVIQNVPVNVRTVDRLVRISAGVSTDNANNPRVAGSPYWGGIEFSVDGIAYNDSGNGGGAYSSAHGLATQPSIDTISEFKMDSNSQKAEFEGAVAVTIVTKSGTNSPHGSLLWFNRNREYAAQNAFATSSPKAPLNRNEFGFSLGGPIIKDKTFFFASYEGLRERSSKTVSLSLPTTAMRGGDFSGFGTINDAMGTTPFSNSQIPTSRIDSRATSLLSYLASPNKTGTGTNSYLNNYTVQVPNMYNIDRGSLRIDHRATSSDAIGVSMNYANGDPYFVAQGYSPAFGSWKSGGFNTKSISLTYTKTISATVLNEARIAYMEHSSVRQGMNESFDPTTLFPGLYKASYGGLPYMNVSSYFSIGDYGGTKPSPQMTPQYIDNLTIVRGKHTIKAGIDFANYRAGSQPQTAGMGSGLANNAGLGRFDFTGRYSVVSGATSQPYNSFADYMLGYANATYRSSTSPAMLLYCSRYSAYVQDDIQLNRKLSMNVGLRYSVQTAWKERSGIYSNFDFTKGKLYVPGNKWPAFTQQSLVSAYGIVLGSDASEPEQAVTTDKNNWAPRIGFAYRPLERTVIRGGFGVYYNFLPVYIGYRQLGFNNTPYLLAESYTASASTTPSLTLATPFPGTGSISANPSITAVQHDIRNAESYQWNLTMERELLKNLGLRLSYVGNRSTHLPFYNYPKNLAQAQTAGSYQPYRPYQPWADINILTGVGVSTMHSMQVEAVRRFANGLSFQIEYAWTRSLDNTPVTGGPQDPYNAMVDWGNSDQMRRHVFTMAYSYDLPFGKGKRFLTNAGPVVNRVVSGWQLGGITYLRTGAPFSLSYSTGSYSGWRGGRPNATCNGKLDRSERGSNKWFNAACYAAPTPYTYGNMARNSLFAPGDMVFDVSVLKDVAINDRVRMQLRGEFFNMPNHTNLSSPATNISVASTVGTITSSGDPRQVQVGMKLLW